MKHLLNTLYILTPKTYLHLDGETVAIRREGKTIHNIPLHTLDGIVAFGQVACTPKLLRACADRGITVSFMSTYGRFYARVQGPISGNVLLRRAHYRAADDPAASARIAQAVLSAKVANCRLVLRRALHDHPSIPPEPLHAAINALRVCLQRLQAPLPLNALRGLEGDASRIYFSVFDHLIVAQKDAFNFHVRNRRPPLDRVNAMLSFIYSVLTHDACSALEGVGLDPQVGFLHRDRPGRPSLALDLVEQVRPVLGDRLVLSLINRQQVRPDGFRMLESGAVLMDDNTRKTLITAYQKRKQETFQHPFLGEKIQWGLLLHVQALLLARYLRGDLDAYPAYFWR